MGTVIHDAIVVTGLLPDIKKAHAEAVGLQLRVSDIVAPAINGVYSFLIAPDGSKEESLISCDFAIRLMQWEDWARDCYDAPEADQPMVRFVHVRFGEIDQGNGCGKAYIHTQQPDKDQDR